MGFRNFFFFSLGIVAFLGCAQDAKKDKRGQSNCVYEDTVSINNLMGFSAYQVGNRVYPNPCLDNEEAMSNAEKTGVYSIVESKTDTLFVFSDKHIFSYELNKNNAIPLLNDSILQSLYSKYYEIETDPDPPFWTTLINEHDSIIVSVKKAYESYTPEWIYGKISDTTFRLNSFLQVGMSKDLFFNELGVKYNCEQENFTVVLSSIYDAEKSWYKKLLKKKIGEKKGDLKSLLHSNYINYILVFQSGVLVEMKLI